MKKLKVTREIEMDKEDLARILNAISDLILGDMEGNTTWTVKEKYLPKKLTIKLI